MLEGEKYASDQSNMQMSQMAAEMEAIRRENELLRREQQYSNLPPEYQRDRPGTANTIQPPQQSPYPSGHAPPQPMQVDPSRSLPPLANGIHAGSSMQGVQYTDEQRP